MKRKEFYFKKFEISSESKFPDLFDRFENLLMEFDRLSEPIIDYFSKNDNIIELLDYIIKVPPDQKDYVRAHRCPYYSCLLLSSKIDFFINLFQGRKLLINDSNLNKINEAKKIEEKKENEIMFDSTAICLKKETKENDNLIKTENIEDNNEPPKRGRGNTIQKNNIIEEKTENPEKINEENLDNSPPKRGRGNTIQKNKNIPENDQKNKQNELNNEELEENIEMNNQIKRGRGNTIQKNKLEEKIEKKEIIENKELEENIDDMPIKRGRGNTIQKNNLQPTIDEELKNKNENNFIFEKELKRESVIITEMVLDPTFSENLEKNINQEESPDQIKRKRGNTVQLDKKTVSIEEENQSIERKRGITLGKSRKRNEPDAEDIQKTNKIEMEKSNPESKEKKIIYLKYFFSFLANREQLNSVLTGYFEKIFVAMLGLKNLELYEYIINDSEIIDGIIFHINNKAISNILFEIFNVSIENKNYIKDEIKKKKFELIQKVFEIFSYTKDDQIQQKIENISNVIINIAKSCSSLAHGEEISHYMLQENNLAIIFNNIHDEQKMKYLNYIIRELLESVYPKLEEDEKNEYLKKNMINSISLYMNNYNDILNSDLKASKYVNSQKIEYIPFGHNKLSIISVIKECVNLHESEIENSFIESKILILILKDLFFNYQWHNILHSYIEDIFNSLLKSKNEKLISHIFEEIDILSLLIEHTNEINYYRMPKSKTPRKDKKRGNLGMIVELINQITDRAEKNDQIKSYCDINDDWKYYINTWVKEMNSTQSIELGTGTFRKPRRSSILPPEMQKQKYQEIIKTKEDLERRSLLVLTENTPDDSTFDFSPSIRKKTKHPSLFLSTNNKSPIKFKQKSNTLFVDNNNTSHFQPKKQDERIIETITIPDNHKLSSDYNDKVNNESSPNKEWSELVINEFSKEEEEEEENTSFTKKFFWKHIRNEVIVESKTLINDEKELFIKQTNDCISNDREIVSSHIKNINEILLKLHQKIEESRKIKI